MARSRMREISPDRIPAKIRRNAQKGQGSRRSDKIRAVSDDLRFFDADASDINADDYYRDYREDFYPNEYYDEELDDICVSPGVYKFGE